MKPKKVMCPICGEEMIASSWGMRKHMHEVLGGALIPGENINHVNYECGCGCKVYYAGTRSCWE